MITVYKIRNKETGLFKLGGAWPRWSKTGKIWASKRALSLHFSVIREYLNKSWVMPDTWEVLEYSSEGVPIKI